MSGPCKGFTAEQRDDAIVEQSDDAIVDERDDAMEQPDDTCSRDTMDPVVVPTYHSKEADIANPGQRSIGAISKDMIRNFQTTIQGNPRAEQMIHKNESASMAIQPSLQKFSSDGSRIGQSLQQLVILDGVSGKLSMVNDRLGSMMRRSSSTFQNSASTCLRDRGIYSSQSVRAWGSTVSAEISSFTSQKVVPLFRRQNTYPSAGNANHSSLGGVKGSKDVSFDYQLMKDNE
jgi:hypothetical protein